MATSGIATRGGAPLLFRGTLPLPAGHARTSELHWQARAGAATEAGRRALLSEEVFRGALCRERKRADRFEEPFLLVTVSLPRDSARRGADTIGRVVEALRVVSRDTDIIGWLKSNRVLGLIVPAGIDGDTNAGDLSALLKRELSARLDADTLAGVVPRLRMESGCDAARIPPTADADGEIRTRSDKARAVASAAAKRALDIAGSSLFLIVTAPLFAVIAALVKLTSRGPVLFRQERVGWTGRPFVMLKFRTMYVDADSGIHQQYIEQFIKNNEAAAGGDAGFKIRNDPRVTAVGRWLRKTSLDELPQFWNVLRSDMSLVGPRPPLGYEVDRYRRWHRLRVLEAKPGITGLWQVVGRSRTTFDDMVRLDVRYARTRSFWLDIKILLATPWAVLSGKGAC